MDLRRLRYFLVLSEELNFTRAAHRLHIAQPALSQQIRALERDIGAPLLERGSRGCRLTAVGEVVKPVNCWPTRTPHRNASGPPSADGRDNCAWP
jgi:DNA-binding transcriptional LysR family regulator